MQMNKSHNSEFEIIDAVRHLDFLTQGEIGHALVYFSDLLKSERVSMEAREDFSRRLKIYLSKKINELEVEVNDPHGEIGKEALWRIRNDIVHGVFRDSKNYEKFYPILWRELGNIAKHTEPKRFEKIMSFCFGYNNPNIDSKILSSTRVYQLYRSYFRTLPSKEKSSVFTNLLMRMFDRSNINF